MKKTEKTVALFIIAKIWKQPTCPLVDEWINHGWRIHEMEYYSPIKQNEIFPLATTWKDLECIMLSEIKNTVHSHFYVETKSPLQN